MSEELYPSEALLLFSLSLYLAVLSALALHYHRFARRGWLSSWEAVALAALGLSLFAFAYFAVDSIFPLQSQLPPPMRPSRLFFLTLILALALFIIRVVTVERASKSVLEEREVRGVRFRVYRGPCAGAFCIRGARAEIYVHEELLRTLSPEELEAVLRHEERHSKQPLRPLLLELVGSLAPLLLIFGGLTLVTLTAHLIGTFLSSPGAWQASAESIIVPSSLASLFLLISSASTVATYAMWAREHDADIYAAKKVGVEVLAKALIKMLLASCLDRWAKYTGLGGTSMTVRLNEAPPLTRKDALRLLLTQPIRGFAEVLLSPLETSPPLHIRLRVLQAARCLGAAPLNALQSLGAPRAPSRPSP